jgi:hypothetical protein
MWSSSACCSGMGPPAPVLTDGHGGGGKRDLACAFWDSGVAAFLMRIAMARLVASLNTVVAIPMFETCDRPCAAIAGNVVRVVTTVLHGPRVRASVKAQLHSRVQLGALSHGQMKRHTRVCLSWRGEKRVMTLASVLMLGSAWSQQLWKRCRTDRMLDGETRECLLR